MQPYSFSFDIPSVAKVIVSHYTDRTLIVLTETNRLGTLMSVEADNPEETGEGRVYSVRTLFGGRSDEFTEALVLGLAELMHPYKPILLSISLTKRDSYTEVMEAFKANIASFKSL
mmetsp:Transcript_2036/g.4660  ORF Transcript_2036/g.4660 Transcript_2036/m.4660 type:complete len:116 (+) Transcript_2036:3377-3724(+)